MILKEYTTEARVETFLKIAITSGAADDAINAAVAYIDQITGRNFIADQPDGSGPGDGSSVRLFDGKGGPELAIDECVEITEVKVGADFYGDTLEEVEADLSGYITLPRNRRSNTGQALPIDRLRLRTRYWTPGKGNHSIKARWGYSDEVPEGIAFAATVIAAGVYNSTTTGGSAAIKSESIGNYSVTYDNDADWTAFKQALGIIQGFKLMTL